MLFPVVRSGPKMSMRNIGATFQFAVIYLDAHGYLSLPVRIANVFIRGWEALGIKAKTGRRHGRKKGLFFNRAAALIFATFGKRRFGLRKTTHLHAS